jgi:hypothetical protein
MEEDKDNSHHSQEVEMQDSSQSSLVDMRQVKIKSITGITYELTVPKDVS